MAHQDPMSGTVRWAFAETRRHLNRFSGGTLIVGLAVATAGAIFAPTATTPTLRDRLVSAAIALVGGVVAGAVLLFSWALVRAPFQQKHALVERLRQLEVEPGRLAIHGGNGGDFNFVDWRAIGEAESPDKRSWMTTALVIENASDQEASRCRVRITDLDPGHSFQGLPYTLPWWPSDVEEMDLEPRGKAKVVLARAAKTDFVLPTSQKIAAAGRELRGPFAENPEHEVTITVVTWPSGQPATSKRFLIRGFTDASLLCLDVQEVS